VTERALVVVPTYNEAVNLPSIVPQILAQDPRLDVLIVDDNSPDGTGELADQMAAADGRVHVLHRPGKGGLGKAYLAGFRWALERDYELVFEMDADFSHDPKFLADFLRAAEEADLVIGSRYKTGVNVINWPISRLLLSLGANQYARWITGMDIMDSTGGFKCFHRRVLETIDFDRVRSNGYSF
jgi:dolichol-phosphate mannosyltransferase